MIGKIGRTGKYTMKNQLLFLDNHLGRNKSMKRANTQVTTLIKISRSPPYMKQILRLQRKTIAEGMLIVVVLIVITLVIKPKFHAL